MLFICLSIKLVCVKASWHYRCVVWFWAMMALLRIGHFTSRRATCDLSHDPRSDVFKYSKHRLVTARIHLINLSDIKKDGPCYNCTSVCLKRKNFRSLKVFSFVDFGWCRGNSLFLLVAQFVLWYFHNKFIN